MMKMPIVKASAVMEVVLRFEGEFSQAEIDQGVAEFGSVEQWLRVDYPDAFTKDHPLSGDFRVYDAEVES
jgi:hypothetical protein